MRSFILRIYRIEKGEEDIFSGVLEETGKEQRRIFTSIEELYEILTESPNMEEDIETQ